MLSMAEVLAQPVDVIYPDSDGMPMAENTVQYEWIVTIKGNLDIIFRDKPDVFVAGDHLIYPVKGDPTIRVAPDVYVAFHRPKGHRGSYRVWDEEDIFPQVIIEVLSPGNRMGELMRKYFFYERYGAEEYYVIDPERNLVEGYVRREGKFDAIQEMNGWVSPSLGVRFQTSPEIVLFTPDDQRFKSYLEFGTELDAERERAQQERQRADRLAAKLRELGIDPNSV